MVVTQERYEPCVPDGQRSPHLFRARIRSCKNVRYHPNWKPWAMPPSLSLAGMGSPFSCCLDPVPTSVESRLGWWKTPAQTRACAEWNASTKSSWGEERGALCP